MKRSAFFLACFFIIMTCWFVYLGCEAKAQSSTFQSYVVKYGDTLWDIAGTYLNNPYRWREIHQNNSHIKNPNLIYPGDVLRIIPTGKIGVQITPTVEKPGEKKLSDKLVARPWYGLPAPAPEEVKVPVPPQPIVPSPDFIEALGYIVPYSIAQLKSEDFAQLTGMPRDNQGNGARLIHSEYGQPGLIYGDTIYINRGISHNIHEGDVFLAFRPLREIYHPITSEFVGTQINVLGRVRVKTLEPEISAAEIVKSYFYMAIGDSIMPVSELSLPLAKLLVGDSRSYGVRVGNQLIAHIIAERVGRIGISEGDIVFIDVGAAQGIQPADSFIIFREIGEGYPKQAIGRVLVLGVQKQTAIALVTESVKTIEVGEKIVLKR